MDGRKKGTGRRKVDMKKIENKNYLKTTFTKRRKGLFKKAGQLNSCTGGSAAVVTFSPHGRPYAHGSPDADSVIDRFLRSQDDNNDNDDNNSSGSVQQQEVATAHGRSSSGGGGLGRFLGEEVEGMDLQELISLKDSISELNKKVKDQIEETRMRRVVLKDFLAQD